LAEERKKEIVPVRLASASVGEAAVLCGKITDLEI
jgi:hypothetical protein